MPTKPDTRNATIAAAEPDWMETYEREKNQAKLRFDANKRTLFETLKSTTISHVTVEFDGSCDSGQIQSVTASTEGDDGEKPMPAIAMNWYGSPYRTIAPEGSITLADAIEELCYDLLEQDHGGWENDAGAFGTFSFDVATGTISLEFNGRFEDYHTSNASY